MTHEEDDGQPETQLFNDAYAATPNRSFPENCLVFGYTSTDRFISAAFEILDEDVPIIRPITAFEPSED